jgi:hypothetical protein
MMSGYEVPSDPSEEFGTEEDWEKVPLLYTQCGLTETV